MLVCVGGSEVVHGDICTLIQLGNVSHTVGGQLAIDGSQCMERSKAVPVYLQCIMVQWHKL